MIRKISIATMLAGAASLAVSASDYNAANDFNPIQTGVNSLDIAPDARGASMGDLGVASDPDCNSQFWNPSKYAFAYSSAGVSLSYTPWLRKLVNDIFLANVSGYWKIGSGDNQAISASLRYFSLGEVSSGGNGEGSPVMTLNPYEMAVDVGYSRKLSEKFSMGVAFRYIYSDLGFTESESEGGQTVGASAFAADIGGYYTTFPVIGRNECQWSLGFNLSNIGSKVNYDRGANPAFLPAQLRLGTAFTVPLADYHLLSFNLDLSKIMVPTMPRENDYDMETEEGQAAFAKATRDWQNMSSISGIFKSFADGSAKEELQEIRFSLGAEYSYNDQFFVRAGYFYEHPNKGNRQYLGFGAGFALKVVRLDASYMVATAASSPLDSTLRFSLTFDMDGIKDLFKKR
ncbi:MAG: type IX secretion system outer membrane channel protein PorV [Muribaculaceae bacterium]|nr:type IX secretion system outer membrane channel protein PorV [Muribaculaceae bacterium]